MFVSLPTSDGLVMGILGFSYADLDAMKDGSSINPIDMRANFEVGVAVPTMIQIVVQPTDEDIWELIYEAAPGSRGKLVGFDSDEQR